MESLDRILLGPAPKLKREELLGSRVDGVGRSLAYFRKEAKDSGKDLARAFAQVRVKPVPLFAERFPPPKGSPGERARRHPHLCPHRQGCCPGAVQLPSCSRRLFWVLEAILLASCKGRNCCANSQSKSPTPVPQIPASPDPRAGASTVAKVKAPPNRRRRRKKSARRAESSGVGVAGGSSGGSARALGSGAAQSPVVRRGAWRRRRNPAQA